MRRVFACWLLALVALLNLAAVNTPRSQIQTEPPITVEAYWELVRNTRQAIPEFEALPDGQVQERLEEFAAEWEKVTAVEFSDQTIVTVDSSALVYELRINPPDLERLMAHLDALLEAHEAYPQAVFTLQDVEPLRAILARPEFQWAEPQVVEAPSWFQKLLEAFYDLMERLAFGIQNTAYYWRVPLIIGVVALFLFSLYFISRNLTHNLVREAQLAAENGESDELLTSARALQRAQTLSNQGDYRNAVRYLYLSSLLILDERGLLRYDRSRTNREYLRNVSSRPELSAPLKSVIDVFDRTWYGFEAVDEQTYQSYVKHVDELKEQKE